MSKHNEKDSFRLEWTGEGLVKHSIKKQAATDGNESRPPNATAESIPAPSQSQSLVYQADPMTPEAVAKMAAHWAKYHPEAATYQKRVTEAVAPVASTATKSTPGADSCTNPPEPASKSVPNASTTKTAAKPTPNSNGDWLPCAPKHRLNYVGPKHSDKSAADNAATNDEPSQHSATKSLTTSQGGGAVTASTPAATGSAAVEWDDCHGVPISETKRDEWVARLLSEVPLGTMQYIASGDSVVLVHHTDDGFEVFDMVPRREGHVPHPELPLEDVTEQEVAKTRPMSDIEAIYRMNYDIIDRSNGRLGLELTGAPGMPRSEHDKLADFFFGKPGNR